MDTWTLEEIKKDKGNSMYMYNFLSQRRYKKRKAAWIKPTYAYFVESLTWTHMTPSNTVTLTQHLIHTLKSWRE